MIRPSGDVSSVNGSTNFVDGKYYHFYDYGLTDGKPLLYRQLLANAKKSIMIWDPHYSNVDVELFSDIHQDGIYIEVLTICEAGEAKSDMDAFAEEIVNSLDEKLTTCVVNVIALIPKFQRRVPWTEWHDRYLIIDGYKVYLVGASLDAQNNTSKSFGIYQLTEADDINLVLKSYEAYRWSVKDVSGGALGNGYKCSASR